MTGHSDIYMSVSFISKLCTFPDTMENEQKTTAADVVLVSPYLVFSLLNRLSATLTARSDCMKRSFRRRLNYGVEAAFVLYVHNILTTTYFAKLDSPFRHLNTGLSHSTKESFKMQLFYRNKFFSLPDLGKVIATYDLSRLSYSETFFSSVRHNPCTDHLSNALSKDMPQLRLSFSFAFRPSADECGICLCSCFCCTVTICGNFSNAFKHICVAIKVR